MNRDTIAIQHEIHMMRHWRRRALNRYRRRWRLHPTTVAAAYVLIGTWLFWVAATFYLFYK